MPSPGRKQQVGDLFGARGDERRSAQAPLADRIRPTTIDEVVGHDDVIGPGRTLRSLIDEGRAPSLILWGPPGAGKTTLARIIADACDRRFITLSAVESGVKDIRATVADAREAWRIKGRGTVLFVDEIHRFNRAQQDVLLPHVEDGTFTFIGATTENPSFEIVSPLLSRCRLIVLKPIEEAAIVALLQRALDDERGVPKPIAAEPDALSRIAALANGDARTALNLIEWSAFSARRRSSGPEADADATPTITDEDVAEAALGRRARYDKGGEEHFDQVSALQKSIRGSDPQAAVYWLTRMLEGGEDPVYIARRLVRTASEDVGHADPQALSIAVAAMQAVQLLGMPEGALALVQAATWLAIAPKSNALETAYLEARRAVREEPAHPVPLWLRNAPTKVMAELGYGDGYRYAHDYEGGVVPQAFLPEEMGARRFYRPLPGAGLEDKLRERLERLEARKREMAESGDIDAFRRGGSGR